MRRVVAAVVTALTLAASAGISPVAAARPLPAAAQQPPARRLTLVAQSPFVGAGGEFNLRLRVARSGMPPNADIAITIFRPIQSRSEFEQTLRDRMSRGIAAFPGAFPLASLNPDANGEVSIRIPVRDPTQAAEAGRIDLGEENNVFPVRVELRERSGTPIDRLTTHLVHLPGGHPGPKLALAMIFPVRARLGLPPDGERQVPGLEELVAAVQALEFHRGLPFALAPSPETLQSLEADGEERTVRAIESLRRLAGDHPVIAAPYVPVSLPALLNRGLENELDAQLARGTLVLTELTGVRPDARTWIEREPLEPESLDELVRRGVERFISPDAVLDPVPDLSLTLSRPFVVAGREEDLSGGVADAGLAAHFNGAADQVLQAHHLLADLAVLWLDAPGSDRRGVIAMPPPDWRANRAFLDTLAAGLAQHPVAEATSLDTIFSSVKPATTPRGTTLVRHPANVPVGDLGDVVPELRQVRQRLASLGTVLPGPTPASTLLDERLLVAQSSELDNPRSRHAYVAAVANGIADHLDAIEMPQNRSITLTARRGQIPVTFQNRTGTPARVLVRVQSDKLEFPGGESRPLELARRNTTERFSVVARTSGAFPLRITLQSPDGNLIIDQARLTVRSTAASRVSLAVSAGAAAFLALWWGRHIARGRRARRLVPA